MSDSQDKALHLLFRTITPGRTDPADDLIQRLREIRDAKDLLLEEDEYEAWRDFVMDQVTKPTRVPWPWVAILAFGLFGGLGLVAWGIWSHAYSAAVGGAAGAITSGFLWYGMERDYAAKRKLSREDRLVIIDHLVCEHILDDEEAKRFRSKVEEAYPKGVV